MIEQHREESRANGSAPIHGMKFVLEEVPSHQVSVKVVGIGGCGGNIVDYMIESGLEGVDFVCVNTDEQALKRCKSPVKLQIGKRVTHGYGSGANPEIGREAAIEDTESITEMIGDANLVFLVVGLGGGTGTGAAPVIGGIAQQTGALTIAAAVTPFAFEGKRKIRVANDGFEALIDQVDTAIEISNERLMEEVTEGKGFFDSFRMANRVSMETLMGITEIISKPGIMNCDFSHLQAVLREAGVAVVGAAQQGGRGAAVQAARHAIGRLANDYGGLAKAGKVLVNITATASCDMRETGEALQLIESELDDNTHYLIGTVLDDALGDEVRVMVVASGFERGRFHKLAAPPQHEEQQEASEASSTFWTEEPEPEAELAAQPEPEPQPAAAERAASPPAQGAAPPEPVESRQPYQDVRAVRGLPTKGRPIEYMPPPNIRAVDDDEDEAPRRSSFFRRFGGGQ